MVIVRGLLVPATALSVALGPVVTAPAVTAPLAPPVVHVDAIALAGIGQDIYNAISPVVQYVVGGVSYLINFIPLVGGVVAAQINIDYFQGIQPAVAATVDYAAAVLRDPLDFFPITGAYVRTLFGIGYDLVSAQLRFLGFPELPPRATDMPSPRVAAASAPADAAVAAPVRQVVTPAVAAPRARPESRSSRTRSAVLPVARRAAAVGVAEAGPAQSGPEKGDHAKPGRHGRASTKREAGAGN